MELIDSGNQTIETSWLFHFTFLWFSQEWFIYLNHITIYSNAINVLGLNIMLYVYTGEPIYFYMIGKNVRHNQILISENDRL